MAVAAAVALIVFAMGACVTPVRVGILQRLGWALVAEDPLTRADAIVLTVDVGRAGVLEAADWSAEESPPASSSSSNRRNPRSKNTAGAVFRSRNLST